MITLMALTAIVSCTVTMIKISNLPADQYEYMQMENRWANWPQKDCYNAVEVELILNGPQHEYNKETYPTSDFSKFVWITRQD
jgi:hypothetical protein